MNTTLTVVKATGMSFMIFWIILFTEEIFHWNTMPYIFLSVIPIGLCCTLTICLTIAPFYWAKNSETDLNTVYSTYFPFYTIVLSGICISVLITSNFNTSSVAFITSAFFTLLKSWSWIIKPSKNI